MMSHNEVIVLESDDEEEIEKNDKPVKLTVAQRVKFLRERKRPATWESECPKNVKSPAGNGRRKAMKEIQNSPQGESQQISDSEMEDFTSMKENKKKSARKSTAGDDVAPQKGRSARKTRKLAPCNEEIVPNEGLTSEPRKTPTSNNDEKEPDDAEKKPKKRVGAAPKKRQAAPACKDEDDFAEEPVTIIESEDESEENVMTEKESVPQRKAGKILQEAFFPGRPMPSAQARRLFPHRYDKEKVESSLHCAEHFADAVVDGEHYKLGDCVTVNGDGGDYLGKVVEFFRTTTKENWFRVQWFFRFSETTIGNLDNVCMDNRRIFASELEDDNYLECITGKITVSYVSSADNFFKKGKTKLDSDYYVDMGFRYDFSTFHNIIPEGDDEQSSVCNETASEQAASMQSTSKEEISESSKTELTLLDLYSGCGGMSTGLSMGAALGGINLTTKWALDLNEHACASMKHNHPETEVRNEDAESFLLLLKEWQKLCKKYQEHSPAEDSKDTRTASSKMEPDEYEVERVVGIRMAPVDGESKRFLSSSKAEKPRKRRLEFLVHWKGWTADYDTWEPLENLHSCQDRIHEFVMDGMHRRILPLPGEVDVICGGPPCQGASGFNRFRNKVAPLECPRNRQMMIYMDIVDFLQPKFVLMENVVDILKFCGGILGRYAMFRLVNMHYQAKLGLMVAGSYGLPQFRMRVFLWGAAPSEVLPAFPLPTHEVENRGVVPNDYQRNLVKHPEESSSQLRKALLLEDAISDLPPVENSEKRNEMSYDREPKTKFQRYIRSAKHVFYTPSAKYAKNTVLHDHRPLQLNQDDYQRSCRIPKFKGANFRHLGGVRIRDDNTVELDPDVEREYLASGKPLVPDYAISFVKGKSVKPFARLWWDETVPTVVTRAEPHNQKILHPLQNRVLTIRENARLQGFPDWYKLFGPVKERYTQVGNAVAVPVARGLGYALAMARRRECSEAITELPPGFPSI